MTRVSDGADFLHGRGSGKPRRALFIDGEMSQRLMQQRLEEAVGRYGGKPETLFIVNREMFPGMPPLNTDAGQQFIDRIIEAVGGADLVIFDNVQALLIGDMKDEESWQAVLPWVRDLTRRHIGQVWVHHTGHDETHGYGSKTREWQLDTVALMERVERPEADIAFRLSFPKARERAPHNGADFEPAVITLADDAWSSERGAHGRTKRTAKDRALELLINELARGQGAIPPPTNTYRSRPSAFRKPYGGRSLSPLQSRRVIRKRKSAPSGERPRICCTMAALAS